jgi:hypothetical protein
MRGFKPGGRLALSASILALTALWAPLGAQAVRTPKPKGLPRVTTGAAQHVLASSALLTASVNPNGHETSYYFQYGLSSAYTSQTPTENAGAGGVRVKVGKQVSGLQPGATYHFRIVATNSQGTTLGTDRVFAAKGNKLKFVIPKPATDVFGSPVVFSGFLSGFGSANHRIALQASPFPFLESFTNIGSPGVTDSSGRFSFRVANLSTSTQLRVVTLDALPVFSPVVTLGVAVKVSFSARSSGQLGLVRLYGTVSPAVSGAKVFFQVLQPVRPGRSEVSSRYVSQFFTGLKKGGRTFSRFSTVVKIRKGGRYRVFVKVRPGALMSGTSTKTIVLHAAPGRRK